MASARRPPAPPGAPCRCDGEDETREEARRASHLTWTLAAVPGGRRHWLLAAKLGCDCIPLACIAAACLAVCSSAVEGEGGRRAVARQLLTVIRPCITSMCIPPPPIEAMAMLAIMQTARSMSSPGVLPGPKSTRLLPPESRTGGPVQEEALEAKVWRRAALCHTPDQRKRARACPGCLLRGEVQRVPVPVCCLMLWPWQPQPGGCISGWRYVSDAGGILHAGLLRLGWRSAAHRCIAASPSSAWRVRRDLKSCLCALPHAASRYVPIYGMKRTTPLQLP